MVANYAQNSEKPPENTAFSPQKIAKWLRYYPDWSAELSGMTGMSGSNLGPRVQGGAGKGRGGSTARAAERELDLMERVQTVNAWLDALTSLERMAADHWMADGDSTVTQVSTAAGIDYRQAAALVKLLPILIWGHFYHTDT